MSEHVLVEMELVTAEVTLMRAALRLRAREVSPVAARLYDQLADQLEPIGLHQFKPLEAAYACLALKDFSALSREIGLPVLAAQAQDLSDSFLLECFVVQSLDEASHVISQAEALLSQAIQASTQTNSYSMARVTLNGFTAIQPLSSVRDHIRTL